MTEEEEHLSWNLKVHERPQAQDGEQTAHTEAWQREWRWFVWGPGATPAWLYGAVVRGVGTLLFLSLFSYLLTGIMIILAQGCDSSMR